MLFSKDIEPRCAYCRHSAPLESDGELICVKRGVVAAEGRCRKFRYDPLRRVPPKPAAPDFSRLRDEDFSL